MPLTNHEGIEEMNKCLPGGKPWQKEGKEEDQKRGKHVESEDRSAGTDIERDRYQKQCSFPHNRKS